MRNQEQRLVYILESVGVGDRFMNQDTCCAYFKENVCIESYTTHIKRSLALWSYLKRYYIKSIKRLLWIEVDPVEIALLFHDVGKLVEAYRKNRERFRHEIIGSYVVYKVLENLGFDERTRAVVSLAVLLHHEPLIFSAYISRLGERYITISVIRKVIDESDLTIYCSSHLSNMLKELVNYVTGLDDVLKEKIVNVGIDVLSNLNTRKNDIFKVIKTIIVKASIGDSIELHKTRAKVAGLLHPLVVSDSVAAHIGRSLCLQGKESSEGTWVVRRALGLDQPKIQDNKTLEPLQAEILEKEKLENSLC